MRSDDDKTAAAPKKPLDDELERLLADPLRSTRKRYLSPGKYTVEIRSGSETRKTTLQVQPERETSASFGDSPED